MILIIHLEFFDLSIIDKMLFLTDSGSNANRPGAEYPQTPELPELTESEAGTLLDCGMYAEFFEGL